EQEVEGRAGDDHRRAYRQRLSIEGAMDLAGIDLPLGLVEHLDVAAEGNHGDRVFRLAVAASPRHERAAEADRELQDLDAEPARDPEMAELVDRDENADGQYEAQQAEQEIHRLGAVAGFDHVTGDGTRAPVDIEHRLEVAARVLVAGLQGFLDDGGYGGERYAAGKERFHGHLVGGVEDHRGRPPRARRLARQRETRETHLVGPLEV